MKHIYVGSKLTIPSDRPMQLITSIRSQASGKVIGVSVKLALNHTYNSDLQIWLQSPSGARCLLIRRRGGSTDNIHATFADEATVPISNGAAPFTGMYRPEQPLGKFRGEKASGDWTLVIEDLMAGDGGILESWSMELSTDVEASSFDITLRFDGDVADVYKDAFKRSVDRWMGVITGDLPSAKLADGTEVDDLLIYARVIRIDGPSGVLGQAGPTHLRHSSKLPIAGVMEFDVDDLGQLHHEGQLVDTITHEVGHVLGFGTLWHYHRLIQGGGTSSPVFVGPRAMEEYGQLIKAGKPVPIPLEASGGPGTAEGHWSESAFNQELMTGWLDDGMNPLSRVTVASCADLGYRVDMNRADASIGLGFRKEGRHKRCLKVLRPPLNVVYEES